MCMKKDTELTDQVVDCYIGFFTDMSRRVILAYEQLPKDTTTNDGNRNYTQGAR